MIQHDQLNWDDDKDCVRVAEFIINWAAASGESDHNLNLHKVSLYELLDDILTTVCDDRYTDATNALLDRIGR